MSQLIELEPVTPRIGAIVHGVNLTKSLSDEMFQDIHDAWMQYLVLFFRDQPMTPDQHLEFGRRLVNCISILRRHTVTTILN